jgi:hypothetical protein
MTISHNLPTKSRIPITRKPKTHKENVVQQMTADQGIMTLEKSN